MGTNLHNVVSGALYDFMAYLSTLPESVTMGASEHSAGLLDAFKEWSVKRGLDTGGADVEHWQDALPIAEAARG